MRPAAAIGAALAAGALLVGGCGGSGPHGATTETIPLTPETTVTQELPGADRPQIALGDKNTPEEFLLGELYDQALSAEGYSVTLTRNIGPTSVYMDALSQGALNLVPEYLNVWMTDIAGSKIVFPSLHSALLSGQSYAESHAMVLLHPTPFSDTQGIAVTTPFAQAHHLRSLQDLRKVATTLTLGVPVEFQQSPSGLPALEQAYGFQPAHTQPIDIGDQYKALTAGTVQAAYVNTTDGELSTPDYTLLRDPRHILGYGNVVPVATKTVLDQEGPAFVAIIDRVSALLTTPVIRGLNAELEVAGQTPTGLAREFLIAHGMVPGTALGSGAG